MFYFLQRYRKYDIRTQPYYFTNYTFYSLMVLPMFSFFFLVIADSLFYKLEIKFIKFMKQDFRKHFLFVFLYLLCETEP